MESTLLKDNCGASLTAPRYVVKLSTALQTLQSFLQYLLSSRKHEAFAPNQHKQAKKNDQDKPAQVVEACLPLLSYPSSAATLSIDTICILLQESIGQRGLCPCLYHGLHCQVC